MIYKRFCFYHIIMNDKDIHIKDDKSVAIDIGKAVQSIKAAILKSQARAAQMVNHEQLSLYYGIGRYISEHSREGYWGTGAIARISKQLKSEMPGLKGFSEENIKLMRRFYEAWKDIETNSVDRTTEIPTATIPQLSANSVDASTEIQKIGSEQDSVHQLQLTTDETFPITAFLNISFSHHVAIFRYAETYDERKYYIQLAYNQRLTLDDLEEMIKAHVYDHRASLPNNFFKAIPDKALAMRTIQMFKDSYLLDYINVEDIDVSDPLDVDESVIESKIVMNIKNFIMTFGKSFTYKGHQVHYDKFGHDHWIDLLFYNRELKSLVVVELKKGQFKPAYLGQLAAYLRILDDEEKLPEENPSVGIILCKKADKAYVEYVLQDYVKPMGVATYQQMQNRLKELLPPEDEMKRLIE